MGGTGHEVRLEGKRVLLRHALWAALLQLRKDLKERGITATRSEMFACVLDAGLAVIQESQTKINAKRKRRKQ